MNRAATALTLLLLATSALAGGQPGQLREFEAHFAANFRGLNAGQSELKLQKQPDGRWRYSSRSVAQGVFRLAISGEPTQQSLFTLHDGQVKPLEFSSEVGTSSGDRDQSMRFDWDAGRVTGTAEGRTVDLPLEPGVLDAMSVQIAMMLKLINGQSPDRFRMIDKTKIKDYVYTREGEQTVQTPLGPQRTVIYRSTREGATRGTLFWCAPALNHVPVRVERRNGSRVEWFMTLQSLQFGPG
jgi:hypothetical protein